MRSGSASQSILGFEPNKLTIIYMKRKSPCPYSTYVLPSFLVCPAERASVKSRPPTLNSLPGLSMDVRALAMVSAPVCGRKAGVVGHTESARLECSSKPP